MDSWLHTGTTKRRNREMGPACRHASQSSRGRTRIVHRHSQQAAPRLSSRSDRLRFLVSLPGSGCRLEGPLSQATFRSGDGKEPIYPRTTRIMSFGRALMTRTRLSSPVSWSRVRCLVVWNGTAAKSKTLSITWTRFPSLQFCPEPETLQHSLPVRTTQPGRTRGC